MSKARPILAIVAGLVAALFGFAAMCGNNGTKTPAPDAASTKAPFVDGQSPPSHLPSAFSFTKMTDWDEAERVVGFKIPRSKTFPLAWPYFAVQPAAGSPGQVLRTVIAVYKVDGYDVRFSVAPGKTWPAGALDTGERLDIEGRTGWLNRWGEHAGEYTFQCGVSNDFGDVWCLVEFDSRSVDTLMKFVRDLTP